MTPNHLVERAGDRLTMCGLRADESNVLHMLAAPRHTYDMDRCRDCYELAGLGHMIPEDVEVPGQLDMFGDVA